MNLKAGKIEAFVGYSQFKSLQEFNRHMEMWLLEHKQEFSKAELVGLKRLVRFSAKIPGVCNAKIGTMLKAIHEEYKGNGISRSTFKRMIIKAKELGILTIYEMERKNGSQTANLYIFNRFPKNEPPKEEILNHPKETSNLSKTKTQEITKRTEEPFSLDSSFTSDRVPKPFVNLVKYFFSDAKTIEEYWRMVSIAAYRNNHEKEKDQVLDVSIQSFKQLVNKLKSTKKIQNPISYFYGILDKKFDKLFIEELIEMGFGNE
jgi:N-acetylglutamate synthase-like GNAT family acetyltransferase